MQITLNQNEIETALTDFIATQGISLDGKTVDVTLIAGRGPNGMTASVDISNSTGKKKAASLVPTPAEAGSAEVAEDPEDEAPWEESAKEEVEANKTLFGK